MTRELLYLLVSHGLFIAIIAVLAWALYLARKENYCGTEDVLRFLTDNDFSLMVAGEFWVVMDHNNTPVGGFKHTAKEALAAARAAIEI